MRLVQILAAIPHEMQIRVGLDHLDWLSERIGWCL